MIDDDDTLPQGRPGICRGPRRVLACGCSWGAGEPSTWCFSGMSVDSWVRTLLKGTMKHRLTLREARAAYRQHFPGRWMPRS